ncbi:type I-E CRISPR-associated protein Cas7/Cse4/CasC [Microbacterium suaedae]|uniref:type I-E CRISPR-associated protein Cas7/Cse4/CasC n=1 Tax=Microbacterium suaedae TaxID=2067813 RepID=UPI000DA108EF|nr:type I-E CRISPR-associated protein Cas7/Cse4/CasC [Microbacterium suaedae]
MTRTILDLSILHTLPPSNINRDDTGSPKSAVYGGIRRARVSSQAWKRAARSAFATHLDSSSLGVRTKRVVELLSDEIRKQSDEIDKERAEKLAKLCLTSAGIKLSKPRGTSEENPLPDESGYLLFLSARQIENVAAAAVAAHASDDPKASIKAAKVKTLLGKEHSIDVALFGRMVADATDLNVDAAAQVAHAISIHPVETEFDYFTAVDDHKNADEEEDAGAGMIGTVEFNSSTLFRYATVDVDALQRNLGDSDAARRAVEAFVQAFVRSMPTGKQNTFANNTLPDAVVLSIRDTQPVNPVGAFETAITSAQRLADASERLATHTREIDDTYGTTPVSTWVVRTATSTEPLDALGPRVGLEDAVAEVGASVAERLSESA